MVTAQSPVTTPLVVARMLPPPPAMCRPTPVVESREPVLSRVKLTAPEVAMSTPSPPLLPTSPPRSAVIAPPPVETRLMLALAPELVMVVPAAV